VRLITPSTVCELTTPGHHTSGSAKRSQHSSTRVSTTRAHRTRCGRTVTNRAQAASQRQPNDLEIVLHRHQRASSDNRRSRTASRRRTNTGTTRHHASPSARHASHMRRASSHRTFAPTHTACQRHARIPTQANANHRRSTVCVSRAHHTVLVTLNTLATRTSDESQRNTTKSPKRSHSHALYVQRTATNPLSASPK